MASELDEASQHAYELSKQQRETTQNEMQESIFKAIDSIFQDRIDRYPIDRTIVCTIVRCNNSTTGEYVVSFQGGNLTAYAEENAAYSKNTSVYVLVPEGDFSRKKIILGRSSAIGDDENITFVSSAVNDYNPQGRNTLEQKNPNASFGLHSYLHKDYCLIYDYNNPDDSLITIDHNELRNYILQGEAIMIEGSFMTRLPTEHRNSRNGMYELTFTLAFYDRSVPQEEGQEVYKTLNYILNTDNMTGNPYAYITWADQYAIYPIDATNFSHIQSILFWSSSFEEQDDKVKSDLYGADIFCKNLEFYSLKKINAINGDYRLKLATPQGATFKSVVSEDSLSVVARVYYQGQISDGWMFYWFKEDARVTTSSAEYKAYGGAGWASLEKTKGTYDHIALYANENKAFENRYLCVAVYKEEIILKDEFIIYNNACKRTIEIESNLGIKFSFDRGIPKLTCKVNGFTSNFDQKMDESERHPDEFFSFVWSKQDVYGNSEIFDRTKDDLQKRYDELASAEDIDFNELFSLKSQIQAMENVIFENNTLEYPMRAVDLTAIFRCSVYLRDKGDEESYFIGSATITLQNDGSATPEDYFITIENGDQIFQYSESGVSPTFERNIDPQEILPLTCHFYDPAGIEIKEDLYTVIWRVPLSSTMIKPTEDLEENPATKLREWSRLRNYKMQIVDNFDYQALDNQITCNVTYEGQEYQKDTRFSFVKVGDNGTNGTDIAVKISPTSEDALLNTDMLTMIIGKQPNGITKAWNVSGQEIGSKVLRFDAYFREQRILPDPVLWKMTKASSVLEVGADADKDGAALNYTINEKNKRHQIIKAQATIETPSQVGKIEETDFTEELETAEEKNENGQPTSENKDSDILLNSRKNKTTYYAFYPIPIIEWEHPSSNLKQCPIHIDNKYTLKQIIYNSDGRNPLYNKNQGIKLRYDGGQHKKVTCYALGGINDVDTSQSSTAAFQLIANRDDEIGSSKLDFTFDDNGECMIYILPESVYSGMYTNNIVKCEIEGGFTVWMPLHMQLNTVELRSLNAWDGNSIELHEGDPNNEDDYGYLLAPQVGAGVKDEENRFTGLVMGKHQKYDEKKQKIGLLGYSKGQQSIWMDAETGNTILGLTEDDDNSGNGKASGYSEGRIELIPRGTSSIASWKINSEALYNVVGGDLEDGKYDGDLVPEGSNHHIPVDKPGILFNAYNSKKESKSGEINTATYISIKGRPLIPEDNIDTEKANVTCKEGDSFEIELDPNKMSAFTIFIHSDEWEHNGKWSRKKLVGIDERGRFYANVIKTEVDNPGTGGSTETAVDLGKIGAFGSRALSGDYIGHAVDIDDGTFIFKSFISSDTNNGSYSKNPLYLTSAPGYDNEYSRPMSLHGETIDLYIDDGTHGNDGHQTSTKTDRFIQIQKDHIKLQTVPGKGGAEDFEARFFNLDGGNNNISELHAGNFIRTIEHDYTNNIKQTEKTHVEGSVSKNYDENYILTINSDILRTTSTNTFDLLVDGNFLQTVNKTVQYNHGETEKHNIKQDFQVLTGSEANAPTGTGFEISTHNNEKKMDIGTIDTQTSVAHLCLNANSGQMSDLIVKSGVNIRTGGAVAENGVVSNDIGLFTQEGKIVGYAHKANNIVYLRLEPGTDDGNSTWTLGSPTGNISSGVSNINQVEGTRVIHIGASADDLQNSTGTGFDTQWGVFKGTVPNSSLGVWAYHDIQANENLRSNECWLGKIDVGYFGTTAVADCLNKVRDSLNTLSQTINSIKSNVNSLIDKYNAHQHTWSITYKDTIRGQVKTDVSNLNLPVGARISGPSGCLQGTDIEGKTHAISSAWVGTSGVVVQNVSVSGPGSMNVNLNLSGTSDGPNLTATRIP